MSVRCEGGVAGELKYLADREGGHDVTLLAIIVVVLWVWMMTTALHLDDARTESPRVSLPVDLRRRTP